MRWGTYEMYEINGREQQDAILPWINSLVGAWKEIYNDRDQEIENLPRRVVTSGDATFQLK